MPTVGCDNPGTASTLLNASGEFQICTGITGISGGGTLDSIKINLTEVAAAPYNCRIALYDGSPTTGIRDTDGATLIWDSGVFTGADGWNTVTAGDETIPDGTRLFIYFKSNTGIIAYGAPSGETNDGWDEYTAYGADTGDNPNDVDVAYEATIPSDWTGSSINTLALCTQIVYTESSGTVAPLVGRHLQNLMSN